LRQRGRLCGRSGRDLSVELRVADAESGSRPNQGREG